jgi:hypothetical protein
MNDCVQVARIRIIFLGLRKVVAPVEIIIEQVQHYMSQISFSIMI